jgi:hypothetical protein
MKKPLTKRILGYTIVGIVALVAILAVHIYMVTRPGKVDARTVAMARIDFKQDISDADAAVIGEWLTHQQGVERYLCNTKSRILVFSFRPAIISANTVADDISNKLNYKAARYMPSAGELKSGCPVATTSFTYKAYNFFRHIL